MTPEIQALYNEKLTTVEGALSRIQSGDVISGGQYASEPMLAYRHMHEIADRVKDVTFWCGIMAEDYPFVMESQYADSFHFLSYFYGPQMRKIHPAGNADYIPCNLRHMGQLMVDSHRPNIFMGIVTPPDEDGYVTMFPSMQSEYEVVKNADKRIFEINPACPKVEGALRWHLSEIECCYESDLPLYALADPTFGENERKVGENVAALINDGDVLQFGIGRIPNALVAALKDHRHLGIHTEMLGTALVTLMKDGIVDNSRKTLEPGKAVFAFTYGSGEAYAYLDKDKRFLNYPANKANDPAIIAKNDNMVSVNTAIEIDLSGQICSESVGTRLISGTGGSIDYAMGAFYSKGGRGIVAFSSTAKGGEASRIRPVLTPGAAVSIHRNYADYIVTEYGAAQLRGATLKERAERLIAIAHPKFREELTAEAKKFGIL